MIANETKQQETTAGWQQPPLDKMYVLYDEARVSYALCIYAYMLYGIGSDLLLSYDAWGLYE